MDTWSRIAPNVRLNTVSLSVWTNWNMFLTFYQKDAFVLLSCCTEPYLVNYLWLLTGIVVQSYSAHLSLVWRIYWTPTSYYCSWPSSHDPTSIFVIIITCVCIIFWQSTVATDHPWYHVQAVTCWLLYKYHQRRGTCSTKLPSLSTPSWPYLLVKLRSFPLIFTEFPQLYPPLGLGIVWNLSENQD